MGARRADPHARQCDPCFQRRNRPGTILLMPAQTITLGCRLNFAESEAMSTMDDDDAIIVNSCAVTNEAVRQTRQAIRRAHREMPGIRIIVTGCAAQLDPGSFAAMPEVAKVIGNADKYRPSAFSNE